MPESEAMWVFTWPPKEMEVPTLLDLLKMLKPIGVGDLFPPLFQEGGQESVSNLIKFYEPVGKENRCCVN